MSIPVISTALGFYGGKLRPEGDTFTIQNEKELGSWMKRLDEPKADQPAKPKAKAKAKAPAPEPGPEPGLEPAGDQAEGAAPEPGLEPELEPAGDQAEGAEEGAEE